MRLLQLHLIRWQRLYSYVHSFLDAVKKNSEEHDMLVPIIVILSDNKISILPLLSNFNDEYFWLTLRKTLSDIKATEYLFASESWMSDLATVRSSGLSPSSLPLDDRYEAVNVIHVVHGGESMIWVARIRRDRDNRKTLDAWSKMVVARDLPMPVNW